LEQGKITIPLVPAFSDLICSFEPSNPGLSPNFPCRGLNQDDEQAEEVTAAIAPGEVAATASVELAAIATVHVELETTRKRKG
jgi:hypothetical protein